MRKSLLLILMFVSCTKFYRYGSTVERLTFATIGQTTSINYESYTKVLSDLKKTVKNEMLTDKEYTNRLKALPKGGYLLVYFISSISWHMASAENYIYVLQDENGKEFMRVNGSSSIAPKCVAVTYGIATYSGLDSCRIENVITNKFKVYIISKLNTSREEFMIYPNIQY